MSSDDNARQGSRGFVAAGVGMYISFRCDGCKTNRPTLGRKRTRIGWACSHCVRAKAEKVAA